MVNTLPYYIIAYDTALVGVRFMRYNENILINERRTMNESIRDERDKCKRF